MTREELLEKAKELAGSEDLSHALLQVRDLRRQWRQGGSEEESLYDKELSDEFYSYLDQISAKEKEIFASVEERKKDLIEKAKEAAAKANFKAATEELDQIFEEWKAAGRSDKEIDDELWAQFKAVRDDFFARKKEYFANLRESFGKNKEAKEALIEKAKEANKLTNFKEIGNIMNELFEEWKKTGSAGRDNDDTLWAAFNGERRAFFANRSEYFAKQREVFEERANAKKEIIAEAKRCLARSEFTEEEIAEVKSLRAKWKEIGNAGRDNEDALWNEFNETLDRYFENLRYYRD
ncbi:MAG: DUF349 domain-containing protein [Erysipelotrichaceae bacterium]|nr:DUF349 domain-containing protein [Erysipelotrichaceae bacterium]